MTTKPPSDFMRQSLETATSRYASQLNEEAIQYLTVDRGLSRGMLEYFRIGVVADPLPEHEAYRGRVSIPYITPSGVVSLRFRSIGGGKPKYLGMAGLSAKKIFNTRDLYTTQPIFICEGEVDTISAHQCGFRSVGVAGVSNWEKRWWRIFRNRTVIVLADNDDNGQGEGLAHEIGQTIQDCQTVMMPSGHDVNSFFVAEGKDALTQYINERVKTSG